MLFILKLHIRVIPNLCTTKDESIKNYQEYVFIPLISTRDELVAEINRRLTGNAQ